jgi:hypothetical protein
MTFYPRKPLGFDVKNSMIKVKKAKIKERKLGRERAYGLWWESGLIEIDPRQKPVQYFDTLCHEALHACFPELPEYKIKKAASLLRFILWKGGFRKVHL